MMLGFRRQALYAARHAGLFMRSIARCRLLSAEARMSHRGTPVADQRTRRAGKGQAGQPRTRHSDPGN